MHMVQQVQEQFRWTIRRKSSAHSFVHTRYLDIVAQRYLICYSCPCRNDNTHGNELAQE